jgi:hypothetical protein
VGEREAGLDRLLSGGNGGESSLKGGVEVLRRAAEEVGGVVG